MISKTFYTISCFRAWALIVLWTNFYISLYKISINFHITAQVWEINRRWMLNDVKFDGCKLLLKHVTASYCWWLQAVVKACHSILLFSCFNWFKRSIMRWFRLTLWECIRNSWLYMFNNNQFLKHKLCPWIWEVNDLYCNWRSTTACCPGRRLT